MDRLNLHSIYELASTVMTSGKAGGLKTCEPLKAVGNQAPPKGGDYLKMLSWSRIMGSDVIVVPSPPGGQHSGLRDSCKDLAVEQFVSELPVEAFDVSVLPGLPRSMKSVSTPSLKSQDRTALATNSGPLSDRMCLGTPCFLASTARGSEARPVRSACERPRLPDTRGCIHLRPSGSSAVGLHASVEHEVVDPERGCDAAA